MPKNRTDRVPLAVFTYRKPAMSVEDFQAYWRDEHSKIFSSIPIVKKNLLSYEHMRPPVFLQELPYSANDTEMAHANGDALQQLKETGFGTIEADGIAIFEANTYEKMYEIFTDEDYKKTVVPDEEQLLDRGKSMAIPLDIVPIFDDPT